MLRALRGERGVHNRRAYVKYNLTERIAPYTCFEPIHNDGRHGELTIIRFSASFCRDEAREQRDIIVGVGAFFCEADGKSEQRTYHDDEQQDMRAPHRPAHGLTRFQPFWRRVHPRFHRWIV